MNTTPHCINCGCELHGKTYLGFCEECSLFYANPIVHTIVGVIAFIIGFIVYKKMFEIDNVDYSIQENMLGGLVFALFACGWNVMSSWGFSAKTGLSIFFKSVVSVFVGIIGLPIIIFRLFTYMNRN